MRYRVVLAGLAATGGLVTSALLQVATAAADISAAGQDAFTIGSFTFDPFTLNADGAPVEGFLPVAPFSSAPPLLELGGGSALGINLGPQSFEVFNPTTGVDLGSIDTTETVTSLLGLPNTEFTINSVSVPSDIGGNIALLPQVGAVYDELNLGNGYANIYTAIPGNLTGGDTVTDTLITPNGNIDLTPLFGSVDAAAPLQPGDAFTGLTAGDSAIGPDAFTIGGVTLDPLLSSSGAEGFDPVTSVVSAPPLLNIGGVSILGLDTSTQQFDVYSGSGATATDLGTINTGEEVTNLLGFSNTQLTVTSVDPAGASAAGLPTQGTVLDALNLGNGYENVYTAIPGLDGAADKVTDTLITPTGNIDLTSLFAGIDAAAPLQPGDAFTGLQAGDASIGAHAFTIDGTTFDPFSTNSDGVNVEGFTPVAQTIGAPPLLNIGGGNITLPPSATPQIPLATQEFTVYDGSGSTATTLGNITTNENVTQLLGLTNTEFTVASTDGTSADLPTVGSVYDVFNLGNGYENIYTAIPGVNGGADTITDTFITPTASYNLDSLFGGIDAAQLLNPGDAFGVGVEAATHAATAVDPLAFLGL